jgi:hypothetical protein
MGQPSCAAAHEPDSTPAAARADFDRALKTTRILAQSRQISAQTERLADETPQETPLA